MANKTINELTAVASVAASDEIEVQKSGETSTKKATLTQLTAVEAAARIAQDNVIEAGVGLNADGTYASLTDSWYLRAAEFAAGITDRDGASGALTESIANALRLLDAQMYAMSSSQGFISTKTIVCSTADILACNATPKVLIQGISGRHYEIISAVAYNEFGTAAFSAGTDKLEIKYFGGSIIAEFDNAFLEAAADSFYRAIPTANGAVPAASVVLYCATAPTLGDGEITVILTYRVHDI